MTNNYAQVLKRVAWTLIVAGLPAGTTLAAGKNCADLAALPAVVEVGEGMQTAMRSPEAITRLAIGDPKIADVHLNGNDALNRPWFPRHSPSSGNSVSHTLLAITA